MYKILTFKTRHYGTDKKETHKYKERKAHWTKKWQESLNSYSQPVNSFTRKTQNSNEIKILSDFTGNLIRHSEFSSSGRSLRRGLDAFIALINELPCDLSNITQENYWELEAFLPMWVKKKEQQQNTRQKRWGVYIPWDEPIYPVYVKLSELMHYIHLILEEPLQWGMKIGILKD